METLLSELRERDYIAYETIKSWYDVYVTTRSHDSFCKLYGFLYGCMCSGAFNFTRMSELFDELYLVRYEKNKRKGENET